MLNTKVNIIVTILVIYLNVAFSRSTREQLVNGHSWSVITSRSRGWSSPDPGPEDASELYQPHLLNNDRLINKYNNNMGANSVFSNRRSSVTRNDIDDTIVNTKTTDFDALNRLANVKVTKVKTPITSTDFSNNNTTEKITEEDPDQGRFLTQLIPGFDEESSEENDNTELRINGKKNKIKTKKYKKFMLPLLVAYKLKFFTLVPLLVGGLVLLTGSTGLAGFFFALFASSMALKGGFNH